MTTTQIPTIREQIISEITRCSEFEDSPKDIGKSVVSALGFSGSIGDLRIRLGAIGGLVSRLQQTSGFLKNRIKAGIEIDQWIVDEIDTTLASATKEGV